MEEGGGGWRKGPRLALSKLVMAALVAAIHALKS
jgi:hypothetical protein